MNAHVCSVCGMIKAETESWFLLVENRWHDRLKIVRWDENAAKFDTTYHACGLAHAREFLHAWVTAGELLPPHKMTLRPFPEEQSDEVQSIGDLSIHRHSLKNTPEGLKSLLDAVVCALKGEFERSENQFPAKMPPQKTSLQSIAARAS
jgi:hypothetical protein